MQVSQRGLELISSFEGLELRAYVDPATGGEPITIGYGTTIYPNGIKVKLGDICTKDQALQYLKHDTEKFALGISKLVTKSLNQNQVDALISFTYNLGLGNFKSSTLLKKININPSDPTIAPEFKKWNKANSRVMIGLTRRRIAEITLYFLK